MTYLEAMAEAHDNSARVARKAHEWKAGNYVIYNDGVIESKERNGLYSLGLHVIPRYELVSGKRVIEYRPTMADLASDDWFVIRRDQGGDNSGKGKQRK